MKKQHPSLSRVCNAKQLRRITNSLGRRSLIPSSYRILACLLYGSSSQPKDPANHVLRSNQTSLKSERSLSASHDNRIDDGDVLIFVRIQISYVVGPFRDSNSHSSILSKANNATIVGLLTGPLYTQIVILTNSSFSCASSFVMLFLFFFFKVSQSGFFCQEQEIFPHRASIHMNKTCLFSGFVSSLETKVI